MKLKSSIKNKRLNPEERYPPIPYKKVMLHAKDKAKGRKARREEERVTFMEYK